MIRPLWIEVDLGALKSNFQTIRKLVEPKTKIVVTVKQSAYGHGMIPVAQTLAAAGADFFGVGSIEEAIQLRENKIKQPILTLSAVFDKFAEYFIRYNVRPTVVDLSFAARLNKEAAKKKRIVPVHVKVDTGMGRLGLYYSDAYDFIYELAKFKNLYLEGIYTHFPAADTEREFTNSQIDTFNKFIKELEEKGITFKFHHCANSIGIVDYPESHFNMVRPGLILYGIKPSAKINLSFKPVLSLKSKIIFVKQIKKGMGVSYARVYVAKKPTQIATVAAGYADGYPWALSNRAKVTIKDSYFPLAGRVCMDHIMVDIGSRNDIKVGDEVVLIGQKKGLKISAEDLAQWAGTIPYEIVSGLSSHIPRVYKHPRG
ncbi:MAG: alanine racemase [Candidatus Omnitrophota bacterium]|nr:MAG: alanine racemase [Candidatus Omnitrophota bacterium]